jgi:hypothetical protein
MARICRVLALVQAYMQVAEVEIANVLYFSNKLGAVTQF